MIRHAVVVARVGLQFVQLENARVVVCRGSGLENGFAIKGVLVRAE